MFCCFQKTRQDKHQAVRPLTADERIERLKSVELFVLDNSVRETTVAQTRGHTIPNKYEILDLVDSCSGINHVLVGVFGTREKVDDYFCQDLRDNKGNKYKGINLYCFTELRDSVEDGIPNHSTPIGLQRAQEYKIANLIIELDLLCPLTDWGKFSMEEYCALLQKRIDLIRAKCQSPHAIDSKNHIFINIRDFCPTWEQQPERITYIIEYLANHPNRIMGICFEDPTGTVPYFTLGEHVRMARAVFEENGWSDGHLLAHVHQGYGLAEACVLEALIHGATGIWCGICREGAACGHANSLTTIANLHRMGNTYVRNTYSLPNLRQAAIDITKIVTGEDPHPMTEVYGSRVFDVCFDPNSMGGGGTDEIVLALGARPKTRITTMCTTKMIESALCENFGEDFAYDPKLPLKMIEILESDLNTNRKEEYNSVVGFASLYERAGGSMTLAVRKAVEQDKEANSHILILQLHNYCNEWRSCNRANDRMITYIQFYDGFCAKYLPCYACPAARDAFEILDLDNNGYIDWDELLFRAKWVLKEYPDECTDIESMMKLLFEKYIMPEISLHLQAKYALRRKSKHLSSSLRMF